MSLFIALRRQRLLLRRKLINAYGFTGLGIGSAAGLGAASAASLATAVGFANGEPFPNAPSFVPGVGSSAIGGVGAATGIGSGLAIGAGFVNPQTAPAQAVGAALWAQTVTINGVGTATAITGGGLAIANGVTTAAALGTNSLPAAGEADGLGTAPAVSLSSNAAAGLAVGVTTAPAFSQGGFVVGTATGAGAATALGVAAATGVGTATGLGVGSGQGQSITPSNPMGTAIAAGFATAPAFAFRSTKVGWFDEWPKPRRYYDAEELARILGERKRDPIKEAMEERERERVAKRASSRTRFAIAYRDAWVKVRANKGPMSNNLREFMHFLAPYKDSDEVDFEPLIEALHMALETNSAREIAQIMRRIERVMPLVERAYA